jgi:amino acid permease
MGAGTITIPFIIYENGMIFGVFLILFGGSLSLFTGFLIAYAAEITGGHNYEEIAFKIYGLRGL